MSLDGAFLRVIKNELSEKLIGGRVDKIHQPSKEEIIISMRAGGGTAKLLCSANPQSARVCLTSGAVENPKAPPMFCMLLRKHLGNGKLVAIEQDGLERILNLDFVCTNEMGDTVQNRLTIEIMGRSSNIILMAEKDGEMRVIDSIKRVTDDISSVRRVLPNIIYETPPRDSRLLLTTATEAEMLSALAEHRGKRLHKAMISIFEGISPIFARECAYYTARDVDVVVDVVLDDVMRQNRFCYFISKAATAITEQPHPVIVREKSGKPKDFCFVPIEQYGHEMITSEEDSANELLERFFKSRTDTERVRQRSGELLKMLLNTYERIARRVEVQKGELLECKERDQYRVRGDLVSANIYKLEKGMTAFVAEDFETGEEVEIKLDKRLSPSQNAQRYYGEYKKLDTAEKMLVKLIKSGEEELLYIDSVFDAAGRATMDSEISEIRQELTEMGYLRPQKLKGKPQKLQKALPPMRFTSTSGYEILVGRNNIGNDKLTLKTASQNDIWLHTQNIAGSHVIITTNGKEVDDNTLIEAATLAAFCSKARESSGVPVDYTEVRYVKKPHGAKPGMVIFTHNKTLFVTPNEELYEQLKK